MTNQIHRILLLGPAGQIGYEVAEYCTSLHSNGVELDVYDGDILDTDRIASLICGDGYHTIINCAGIASVQLCESDIHRCDEVNFKAVSRILNVMNSESVSSHFINFGSTHEFNESTSVLQYSKTKASCREEIRKHRMYGLHCSQYTLGVCISNRPSKNKGSLIRKIQDIATAINDIDNGIEVSPIQCFNIDDTIRIASCAKIAKLIVDLAMSNQAFGDHFLDGCEMTMRKVITDIISQHPSVTYSFDNKWYYAFSKARKISQKLIEIGTFAAKPPFMPNLYETEDNPHNIITNIVSEMLIKK